jgi:hypothetical protein
MAKQKQTAQNPLILRCHRLMEAFAKSDDERDFYLDNLEGYILYVDLDKTDGEISALESELVKNTERYLMVPKMSFYEAKKIMEGFINEKVYDIDTKEKLYDIIQSKEARRNFLEFIFDHHAEMEKWQQYYQERSRIRIIEWLRSNNITFVFEEDLDISRPVLEKVKQQLFQTNAAKEVQAARKVLAAKAKTYYSNEALNPRPKRGRPPKQIAKTEVEPQFTSDFYATASSAARPFIFKPDPANTATSIFSSDFETEQRPFEKKQTSQSVLALENLSRKLSALKGISPALSNKTPLKQKETDIVSESQVFSGKPSAKSPAEAVPTRIKSEPKPVKPKVKRVRPLPAKRAKAKRRIIPAPAPKKKEIKPKSQSR